MHLADRRSGDIGSWRMGDDDRTLGAWQKECTAYRQTGLGGLPLARRLSEGPTWCAVTVLR